MPAATPMSADRLQVASFDALADARAARRGNRSGEGVGLRVFEGSGRGEAEALKLGAALATAIGAARAVAKGTRPRCTYPQP
jgi:hypothetical protein